jgi:hypothetical protein
VRRILRKAFQGFYDGGFDARIIDRPGSSGPWLVSQAPQTVLYKAPTPLADRHLDHTELRRHLLVLGAFRTGQNDPSPQRQGLGRLATARQCLQLCSLLVT